MMIAHKFPVNSHDAEIVHAKPVDHAVVLEAPVAAKPLPPPGLHNDRIYRIHVVRFVPRAVEVTASNAPDSHLERLTDRSLIAVQVLDVIHIVRVNWIVEIRRGEVRIIFRIVLALLILVHLWASLPLDEQILDPTRSNADWIRCAIFR